MQYRKMGSLDWEVSALGFGCMRLPQRRVNRMRADTEASINLIRYGIDKGVNYIDTAWPYHLGDSEKVVGEALKDGYREKVKLVTKLPMFVVRREEDYERYLSAQLEKLQTEYLDIYLFHALNAGYFQRAKDLGLFEKMEEAKRQGRIRHIGFSFHDTYPVFKEIIDFYDWDMAQIQYNYMDVEAQATTKGLEYAHGKGIAVVIMEPIRGGQLANPPAEAMRVIQGAETKRTPVDWALQYLWNRPEVSVVLSGMGNQQMVDENCASAEASGIHSLNPQDEAVINQLVDIYQKKILVPCTACEYCMPCPAGVNIPKNFAILNNFSLDEGMLRRLQTRASYRRLDKTKEEVDKQDPDGNASLCVECGQCLEKCPQKINIPEELKKTHAVLGKRQKIARHFPGK